MRTTACLVITVSTIVPHLNGQMVLPQTFGLACQQIQITPINGNRDLMAVLDWCTAGLHDTTVWFNNSLPSRDGLAMLAARAASRDSMFLITSGATLRSAAGVPSVAPPGMATSLGLSQGAIILGITDFLIERTEAELQSWLLPRLYQQLCGARDSVASTASAPRFSVTEIFANTCNLLSGTAPFGLSTAAASLRAVITHDLQQLPLALLERLQPCDSCGNRVAYARLVARMMLADEVSSIVHALRRFSDDDAPDSVMDLAHFLDGVLRGARTGFIPATVEEWFNSFRAAVYNLRQSDTMGTSLCRASCTEVVRYAPTFAPLIDHLVAAEATFSALRSIPSTANGDSLSGQNVRADLLMGLLGHVVAFVAEVGALDVDGDTKAALAAIAEAIIAVEVQDFSGAVTTVVRSVQLLSLNDSVVSPTAVRLLTFAADISSSKTPEDVKDAITAFASVAAGHGKKRAKEHDWLLAVQAYGGLSGGIERATSGNVAQRTAPYTGLFFPVGFELTFRNSIIGLFIQVLDLGAVATVRLTGDEGSKSPELGFEQVIAPGGFLTVALPGTPLSIGWGASIVPALRSLAPAGGVANPTLRDQLRITFFAAIDIPIFP